MDDGKISVRTFKDGTKAIEVMEQPEPVALEAEAKQSVAPYTTFNFIRTVQHNFMLQA